MLFFIFSQIHLSLCLTVYKMEAVILKYLGSQPTVLTDNKKTDTFFLTLSVVLLLPGVSNFHSHVSHGVFKQHEV